MREHEGVQKKKGGFVMGTDGGVMVLANQPGHSGGMMPHDPDTNLDGRNRILISAADRAHKSRTETAWWPQKPYEHFAFIYQGRALPSETHDGFILNMGAVSNPKSIGYAYEKGEYATYHNHSDYSYPQIESSDVNATTIYL